MKDWLDYFGYSTENIPTDATLFFYFANLPKSANLLFFGVFVFCVIALIYKMYKKEHVACPDKIKKVLGFTRSILFIALVLIYFEPTIGVKVKKVLVPEFLFFFDNSSSMSIKETYEASDQNRLVESGQTQAKDRSEISKEFLNKVMESSARINEKADSTYYSFDKSSKAFETAEGLQKNLNAEGSVSNIAGSISDVLEDKQNKEIGVAILVSDGQVNDGASLLTLESHLKRKKIPLFVVGVGKPEKAKNVSIMKMVCPERVFKDDPFVISCFVRNSGYSTKEFNVGLYRSMKDSPESVNELVEEKKILIENGEEKYVQFDISPTTEGAFKYTIKTPIESDEVVVVDNQIDAEVDVITQKAKVLLVCGSSSWEYRFLHVLLTRDKTIELSSWLQSIEPTMANEGDVVLSKLPTTKDELFAYDVILLLDPDPAEFDEEWIENLKLFLEEKNGGLLFNAGPKYTSRFINSSRTKSIATLLPVMFSDYQKENTDFLDISYKKEWPIDLTTEGQASYILKFHQDLSLNLKIWQHMPGIYWSFPALKEKPGSRLLIGHPDPKLQIKSNVRPLLVSGQYGLGKTCYMGFTGTWRWRKLGEEYHEKFWIQLVRHLLEGKLEKNGGMSSISLFKSKLVQGEEVQISAKIYDMNKQMYEGEKVELKVYKSDILVNRFELKKDLNNAGVYSGKWKANTSGKLRLELESSDLMKAVKQIDVEAPIVEFYESELNENALKALATNTDGRYFLPSEYDSFLASLPNNKKTVIRNLSPILLWDHQYLLFFLIFVLTFEWVLRKKYKLL